MSVIRRHWSPEPEAAGQQPKAFRHDPYSYASPFAKRFLFDNVVSDTLPEAIRMENAINMSAVTLSECPAGTRHPALWGRVTFVPYPSDEFHAPEPQLPTSDQTVRVFLGQLPYFVTDMQLAWLCSTFGGGNVVAAPERIMKRQPNGERLPTGCIHAYTTVQAVEEMAAGMHKRMLIDDTGVWHAQTEEELDVLSGYIAMMKSDKTRRVPGRPYDTVVVQLATSTFVPNYPMPLTEFPMEFKPNRPSTAARQSSPPPSYGDAVAVLPPPYQRAAFPHY